MEPGCFSGDESAAARATAAGAAGGVASESGGAATPELAAVDGETVEELVPDCSGQREATADHCVSAAGVAIVASAAGPAAPTTLAGQKPAAGVTSPGTSFSVYYFGAGAAGSANAAVTNPSAIWFVDRNPCDQPAVAACST